MAHHDSDQPTGQITNTSRFLVKSFLIETENALVSLQEYNWTGVVQLIIKRLDNLFFQDDKFLLANLDTPFVFDQSNHAIEAW